MQTEPLILSVDTSCDETSVAVTKGLNVLSNIVWSQSKVHAKWGGVVPSVASRQHEMKFSWVLKSAVNKAKIDLKNIDAFSVTVGPGLAVALGVGIKNAKNLALKYKKPLIAVNHLEGHLLSPLARIKNYKFSILNFNSQTLNNFGIGHLFPSFGIVVSGGNTLLVLIENIGKYKILAQTIDDALGESLDKSARLLGFGYPGGAILEKFARLGNSKKIVLPIPMVGREKEGLYSYSGLKAAFSRLYNSLLQSNPTSSRLTGLRGTGKLTKQVIYDLAASYQHVAFDHFIRVTSKIISISHMPSTKYLFVGGGVAANVEFRKKVRAMCKNLVLTPLFPYTKKLYGDNAAMIGVAAYFKYLKKDFIDPDKIDRLPNLKIDGFV